jgi:photosystem II stability/assembly factor-like uncharacterized protein
MNGLGLWLTADGGRHWRAGRPSVPGGDVVARVGQVEFVDAKHGWISAVDLVGDVFRHGSDRYSAVERTTDGGRTWKASAPNCAGCGGSLSFLDARRGFALTGWGDHRLARTTDGGVTWHVFARAPFVGSIEFLDARHGWGLTWSGRLYVTVDGGRTWRRLAFARKVAGLPRFFRRDGVVVAGEVVHVTHDGGATWSSVRAPDAAGRFSAATPRDWFLWAGRRLWRTSDAGRSWSRVPVEVTPQSVWDMTFVSPTTGWAILAFDRGNAAVLARTTNGGRDWLPLRPPVPKPPPLPVPKPICASSCRRP